MSETPFADQNADDQNQDKTNDEDSDEAPNTGVDDQVLVDGPAKLAHEDIAATQAQIDDEHTETRDGSDFEGQPAAAELREEHDDLKDDDEDN